MITVRIADNFDMQLVKRRMKSGYWTTGYSNDASGNNVKEFLVNIVNDRIAKSTINSIVIC